MKQKPNEASIKAKTDALKNLKKMPEKDPTDKERIEKVKILPLKSVPPSDTPASTLFTNFGELSKIASSRYYKDVLGLQFDKGSLIPTDEFITATEEAPAPPEDQIEIDINNL